MNITITFPNEVLVFAEAQVSTGTYSGVDEYLIDLVRQDQQRKSQEHEQLSLLEDSDFRSQKNALKSSQVTKATETQPEGRPVLNCDGKAVFYPSLFSREEADQFYTELYEKTAWQQEFIKLYGKAVPLPRLTAWYGEKQYVYSGISMQPHPWSEKLLLIKSRIELLAGVEFNSVLLNLYRDGSDGVSWHSDDEPELGLNPIIGSVSFGATRRFTLKHRYKKDLKKVDVELDHGSFLLMSEETQHFWLHQVPKTRRSINPRINLTFRVIN